MNFFNSPIDFDFYYLLPIQNDEPNETSIFQGFSPGLLKVNRYIGAILNWPANIFELFTEKEKAIGLRISGISNYNILPLQKRYLTEFEASWRQPFFCIISYDDTIEETSSFVSRQQQPILHISSEKDGSIVSIEDISHHNFLDFFQKVMDFLSDKISGSYIDQIHKLTSRPIVWNEEHLDLTAADNHLVTAPNIQSLYSLRFRINRKNDFEKGRSNSGYINEIQVTSRRILEERNRIIESEGLLYPPKFSMVLTMQSLYRRLYKKKVNIKEFPDRKQAKQFATALRLIQRQENYYFSIEYHNDVEAEALFKSVPFKYLMNIRAMETAAYAAGLSVLTCSNFAPALRLPPALNSLLVDLQRLSNSVRGNKKGRRFKINKICRAIKDKLYENTPEELMELLNSKFNHIKIVADAPLEWLPIRNLPLMLRYDSSRIPVTPGNLFFGVASNGKIINLHQSDFKKILVIRSFKKDDPIREHLKSSIEITQKRRGRTGANSPLRNGTIPAFDKNESEANKRSEEGFKIEVEFIDVHSKDELIQALNEFDGPLVIFDTHGNHPDREDIGSLHIGGNDIDCWELKSKARIPPIVLLSACDTHPIDRSHASTANGFLSMGAATVLGTLLPIDSKIAAMFLARLILRMEQFIPIAIKALGGSVRWTLIIAGLQRMVYITELLYTMEIRKFFEFTEDMMPKIIFMANTHINQFDPNWFENSIDIVEKVTGKTSDEIYKFIDEWYQLPDCLKYIQLGNPENILIHADDSLLGN